MIILGTYPNGFETPDSGVSPLAHLGSLLTTVSPQRLGLHLLPFNPSSGDNGFASDDWFTVRDDLGTWEDVRVLAKQEKLIVDCIYNHVGIGHDFARRFFADPTTGSALVHAFMSDTDVELPRSPRGGPSVRPHVINGNRWLVWQTFAASMVDINLDNSEIQDVIGAHLGFLSAQGIWGVRLDVPAYYGKKLHADTPRHHDDAYRLARKIANIAQQHRLAVSAELDSDSDGLRYFPRDVGYEVPIVDYSYSANLAFAILSGNTGEFAKHLERSWLLPQTLIRSPRTHDGILLRSKNLVPEVLGGLIGLANRYHLPIRVIDDSPYELNCSLPYLCSLGIAQERIWERIELIIATSGFVPGWCYLYLPFVFGHIPESSPGLIVGHSQDPRALNRSPLPLPIQDTFAKSPQSASISDLLHWLGNLHDEFGDQEEFTSDSVEAIGQTTLSIKRKKARLQMLANFSPEEAVEVSKVTSGQWITGRRSSQDCLEPLGFGFWHY